VDLRFQVGSDTSLKKVQADIVVGADGIRSSVRKQLIGDDVSPLRYLDCMVILGICPLENVDEHLLLDGETLFQTANGNERIYMMPYSPTTIMWQLSFPLPEEQAKELNRLGPQALKEEALRRCPAWHDPIPQILAETPVSLISGYPAYDRDLLTSELLPAESRVTLIGDAAHPMSPFKGQGANQALLDALSLARAIYRTAATDEGSVKNALREFEAEMLPRSAVKVKASAEAASFLHTDIAIGEGDMPRGRVAENEAKP
jgi:salicylate hydroxylase